MSNRRTDVRVPLQFSLNEHLRDRSSQCMVANLSTTGIYINRLVGPLSRPNPVVGLEFELPETSEVIWARGEVRYDAVSQYFHGTGFEFTGIADRHSRLIRDYVYERRERTLKQILARIRRNRH